MCHQASLFFVKSGAHSTEKTLALLSEKCLTWCILSCEESNASSLYKSLKWEKRSELPKHSRQSVQNSVKKIKYFRNRRPISSKRHLFISANPLRWKLQHTVGAKSPVKFTSGDAWDAWDEKFPRKSRKDWQSRLSKFANVMLAALLLLHNRFYRYSAFFFQEDSELFTVLWQFQMWENVN